MIRNLLATTAIATLVATGAYAQTDPAPMAPMEQTVPQVIHAEGHLASNIIGQTVYSGAGDDAENIGSVTDLVISPDGDIDAIVVGVGGFLGLGRKDVAIDYNLAEWTEREGNQWLVVSTNREALEALPDFDTSAFRPMPADAEVGNTTPATAEQLGIAAPAGGDAAAPADDDLATAPADDAAPADDDLATAPADEAAPPAGDDLAEAPADDAAPADDDLAQAPADDDLAQAPADDTVTGTDETQTSAIDRSTLTDVPVTGMSADDFIGTTVYGANDDNVGSIGDVILSEDGNVEAVIIDVGGFLGIGSKPVAVGLDNLAFLSDADGNHYLYTPFTQDQLEAQPEYDESTFVENRDGQLLIAPAQ